MHTHILGTQHQLCVLFPLHNFHLHHSQCLRMQVKFVCVCLYVCVVCVWAGDTLGELPAGLTPGWYSVHLTWSYRNTTGPRAQGRNRKYLIFGCIPLACNNWTKPMIHWPNVCTFCLLWCFFRFVMQLLSVVICFCFFFSFLFGRWKACSIGLRSSDWLGQTKSFLFSTSPLLSGCVFRVHVLLKDKVTIMSFTINKD